MKINVFAVCVATLALAAGAFAQTPAPPDNEAVGRWFSQNLKRPADWPVIGYSPEMVILNKPTPQGMRADKATSEIRIERSAPVELAGMIWRSATITSDVSCRPLEAVRVDSRGGAPAAAGAPAWLGEMKMTLYEGQNLGGPGRTFALGTGTLPGGLIGDALRGTCFRVLADTKDRSGVATAMLIGRDKASLDAWVKTLNFTGWTLTNVEGTTAVAYREDSRRGDLVRIEIRTEMSEPLMGRTARGVVFPRVAGDATSPPSMAAIAAAGGMGPAPKVTPSVPAVAAKRPAWIRSTMSRVEFDCKGRTAKFIKGSTFDQNGLQGLLDDLPGKREEPLTDKSEFWGLSRTICPA